LFFAVAEFIFDYLCNNVFFDSHVFSFFCKLKYDLGLTTASINKIKELTTYLLISNSCYTIIKKNISIEKKRSLIKWDGGEEIKAISNSNRENRKMLDI
jgi:hypothetical protein